MTMPPGNLGVLPMFATPALAVYNHTVRYNRTPIFDAGMSKPPGLSAEEWMAILEKISTHLQKPTSLCLIGSAPGIFGGQPARLSIDLDSWQKASKFAYADLKQACEKAGVLFNPKGELQPDIPYIQIVEEGIVQVGDFSSVITLMEEGNLTVTRPPIENVIASKLVRMEPKDFDDVAYLVQHYRTSKNSIEKIIRNFPHPAQERAMENLVYLDVFTKGETPGGTTS